MRRIALLVPAALLGFGLVPVSGPRTAAAQEKPTVAGTWTLNADRSDNARDRLNAAMRNQGSASASTSAGSGAAGGGSRSGGRRGGGGGGGGGGGAGAATAGATGAGDAQRGGGRRGTPASLILLQGPSEFTIRFTETSVIVDRGAGTPLEVTTDGKAVRVGYVGAEVEYKAKWNGSKLEIETKLQAGPRIQETYELDKKDPAVMTVDVRFTDPSPQGNVNVHMKRVYDRS